jgi:hypothetical protein
MSDWELFWFALDQWYNANYTAINLITALSLFGIIGIVVYKAIKKAGEI